MSELREALRRMQHVARIFRVQDAAFPEMVHTRAAAERLAAMEGQYPPLREASAKELVRKLRKGADLSVREIRSVPFVLYRTDCTEKIFQRGVRMMKLDRNSHVRRLLYVYLDQYDASEKTRVLSKRLHDCFRAGMLQRPTRFLRSAEQNSRYLFGDHCMDNMTVLLANRADVDAVMESLAFPRTLKGCSFLLEALKTFYAQKKISLEKKYDLFRTIRGDESYQNLFPSIAAALIPQIDALPKAEQAAYKKDALDSFYRLLGDPRFGQKKTKWYGIPAETKRIFVRWLAENDLELFFKIIEATAADRMWSERKAFWKQYIPYITETKVFFGTKAMLHARRLDEAFLGYGELKGSDSSHSVFAFRLGRKVFVEWSHNGALRVWNQQSAPPFFGSEMIQRSDILYLPHEKDWHHRGDWQSKVAYWIRRHCGADVQGG